MGAISSLSFTSKPAGNSLTNVVGSNWEKLGAKVVNMKTDRDVISITHHKGFYTKLKFMVKKAPIEMISANIVFGNGENKKINIDRQIEPEASTRIIDLTGNKRIIKKIKLNYKTIRAGKGRAVFLVWGKH